MKYPNMSWGTMEAVINLVGGEEGVQRLIARELVVVEKSSLQPIKTESRDFPIWKTITLGLHASPKAYRKALESAGFRISDYADQILKKISVSQTRVEVDLVRVTVAELGFPDGARRDQIYARAIELGLQLCPAEVGPALRLASQEDRWTLVGMEPIADSGGYLNVFNVVTDGDDRWLSSHYGRPGSFWDGDDGWVFCRK